VLEGHAVHAIDVADGGFRDIKVEVVRVHLTWFRDMGFGELGFGVWGFRGIIQISVVLSVNLTWFRDLGFRV